MSNKQKRQVIFIMTDTQRKDMVGCYGGNGLETPHLDRLADEGMKFNRAYTCQPVCGPARSALFTGMYPHSNGSWGNSMPLGANIKTIGQRLTHNQIKTAYIGKWHLDGGDYFGLGQCPDGWDEEYWYDMRNYLEELTEKERVDSRTPHIMDKGDVDETFTYGHRCSNRAIDFIKKNKEEDYLLVLSYDEPHDPYLCSKSFAHKYKDFKFPKSKNIWDDLKDKPEHQRVWAGDTLDENKDELELMYQYFFGCNSFVDYEIGRVMEAVDECAEDALIFYTSDHGAMLNSHSLAGKGPVMYDEITNIPFIVRWKGKVNPGLTYDDPVSHIDVVPTIMDYFELEQSKLFEGKSLLPAFKESRKVNDEIFMEFTRYEIDHDGFGGFQPIRAAFDGRYKLVINLLTSDELYDLANDPEEMINLIEREDFMTIRNELHDKLLDWMNETRDPFRGYYWERRSWRQDAREATWDYTMMTRQREDEYEARQLDYLTGLEMEQATRQKGIAKTK